MAAGAELLSSQQPQRRAPPAAASAHRSFYGSLLRPQAKDGDVELIPPQDGDVQAKHRGGSAAFLAIQTWQTGISAVTWLLFTAVVLSVLCRVTHGQWPSGLLALGLGFRGHDAAARSSSPAAARAAAAALKRHYCEDSDPLWCAQALQAAANRSRRGLHTLEACHVAGGEAAISNCMRSCGICAVLLSDCANVQVVPDSGGSCNEQEDVVGEVCANDGDLDREGYCTWLPDAGRLEAAARKPQFVCGHCADQVISPERRAMVAQMAELRLEEDARETERLQHVPDATPPLGANRRSIRERDDMVVQR